MKLDRLETHDRLLEFGKQADYISRGCQECIANRPIEYGNYPFYIFAHKRELGIDERVAIYNKELHNSLLDPLYITRYKTIQDVPTARLIWEPRLTKPRAQENSMLFRAYPPGDNIKIIWMIPARELWAQYQKDKIAADRTVCDSIQNFIHYKSQLESDEPDELPQTLVKSIMLEIGRNARNRRRLS